MKFLLKFLVLSLFKVLRRKLTGIHVFTIFAIWKLIGETRGKEVEENEMQGGRKETGFGALLAHTNTSDFYFVFALFVFLLLVIAPVEIQEFLFGCVVVVFVRGYINVIPSI